MANEPAHEGWLLNYRERGVQYMKDSLLGEIFGLTGKIRDLNSLLAREPGRAQVIMDLEMHSKKIREICGVIAREDNEVINEDISTAS